jgi:hypothetical protein
LPDRVEGYVNPVWKWVAMVAVGIIIGGAPNYAELLINNRAQISIVDVDREITKQQAAQIQAQEDTKAEVDALRVQVDKISDKLDDVLQRPH